jgi:putative GTP pyrophosphokinase
LSSSTFQPPNKEAIKKDYNARIDVYSRLIDEVCFSLKQRVQSQGIELNGEIQHRIKKFESFYDKIVRKQLSENFFEVIEDIAGVRVVCLYRSDLEKIGKIIDNNFIVVSSDIKTQRTPSTEFGYMADHYIVMLPEECRGPRYNNLKLIKCEIQIRTILMDAWDSISHHLDYKQEIDIPSNLRRDFYALSGLFYVADTHFEMLRNSILTINSQLQKSVEENTFILEQEMNLNTLISYLKWKMPKRQSPHDEKDDYSILLRELEIFEYNNFAKLNNALDRTINALEAFEAESQLRLTGFTFTRTGAVRVSLQLLDPRYIEKFLSFHGIRDSNYLREIHSKYKHLIKQ